MARAIRSYLCNAPTFPVTFAAAIVVAALVYVRSPASNFIFDEQEALLANPYVNGAGLSFWEAFTRDFWGLPPQRSIGSYRPIPNLIWRAVWAIVEVPWLAHWVNVVLHATNAALVADFALAATRERRSGWFAGAAFLLCAVCTEAVVGVVGLADVLAGTCMLLALQILRMRLWLAFVGVFAAVTLGFFCKESMLVAVGLVPLAALLTAPLLHPERPRRWFRAVAILAAAAAALVIYTYLRRAWFPVSLPAELNEPLSTSEPWYERALHGFLRWFRQPKLPQDPINNPLSVAEPAARISGALRVFWRGLSQLVWPWPLSGDYSFRQEPIPHRLISVEAVLGAIALVGAPLLGMAIALRARLRERRRPAVEGPQLSESKAFSYLVALGLLWVPLAYFPHSNIAVLLPTVRAERFWYLPAIGWAMLLGVLLVALLRRLERRTASDLARRLFWWGVSAFFLVQAFTARFHAFAYTSDLTFWERTSRASPLSAKAHLNYSVMLGARGRLEERLAANRRAMKLAPEWPMAHVYYGDALCRAGRLQEAWPHYERGFQLGPDQSNLIALGLQCLWDKEAIDGPVQDRLLELAEQHPGSWLAYFARQIVVSGEEHAGIEPKYRPRGYNEGPKQPSTRSE